MQERWSDLLLRLLEISALQETEEVLLRSYLRNACKWLVEVRTYPATSDQSHLVLHTVRSITVKPRDWTIFEPGWTEP